eukprot:TRINITY_DN93367_c0_g1_i1.p1 TRINITY_DN93367_c0_g1~~TRINITY_DN93367_c0_g1_i1.p1  ORF type:complete len:540 (-),score=48.71 TRINITY_DN93367_c0_g1_i1:10-1629(-)
MRMCTVGSAPRAAMPPTGGRAAASAPLMAVVSLATFWVATYLCQWHGKRGPLEVWIEDNFLLSTLVLGCFIVAAWWTIIREAVWQAEPDSGQRDRLWDIAKFGLIWCVLNYHMTAYYSQKWYDSFMMPAFMIMSGLVQSRGGDVFVEKRMTRLLRDNVLNNYLFALVLAAIQATNYDGTLWFLWALVVYRLVINPIVKCFIFCFGDRAGSLLGVATVGLIVWMSTRLSSGPLVLASDPSFIRVLSAIMHLHIGVVWIFEHAVFYVLGLVLSCDSVRGLISKPFAATTAFAYIAVQVYVDLADPTLFGIKCGTIFPHGESLKRTNSCLEFAADVALRSLSALAFIACCAPIADVDESCWFHSLRLAISRIAAKCGSRTLYGYYLHQLLRFAIASNFGRLQNVMSPKTNEYLPVFLQGLFIAALCSPLSERCFDWLVSPQWLVNLACESTSAVRNRIHRMCATDHEHDQDGADSDKHVPTKGPLPALLTTRFQDVELGDKVRPNLFGCMPDEHDIVELNADPCAKTSLDACTGVPEAALAA